MQLSLFFEFQGNMTPGFPTFITLNLFPNPGNWAVRLTISVEIKYVNFFSFCSYENGNRLLFVMLQYLLHLTFTYLYIHVLSIYL